MNKNIPKTAQMKWGKETEYMITIGHASENSEGFIEFEYMYDIEEDGQIEYKFDKKDPGLMHFSWGNI